VQCDGGSWTGDRDEPVPASQAEYADPPVKEVHFKGRRNLHAIMDTLQGPSFNLSNAQKVIYSGASAGGLTSYLHCDAVAGMLPEEVDVRCLGDAGFFIDHPSVTGASPYRRDMKYLFNMVRRHSALFAPTHTTSAAVTSTVQKALVSYLS
jgi:hypothetical protein